MTRSSLSVLAAIGSRRAECQARVASRCRTADNKQQLTQCRYSVPLRKDTQGERSIGRGVVNGGLDSCTRLFWSGAWGPRQSLSGSATVQLYFRLQLGYSPLCSVFWDIQITYNKDINIAYLTRTELHFSKILWSLDYRVHTLSASLFMLGQSYG